MEKTDHQGSNGQQFADYEILGRLGKGAMGIVYRARWIPHGTQVALKVLPPRLAKDPTFAQRFEREIRSLMGLHHPNIARGLDAGVHDGFLYYSMELVEGESLSARLKREKILPEPEVVGILRQISSALEYAHRHNIVHRDIKPSNILLTPAGEARLVDFGLAREEGESGLTQTGTALGTPYYISPEQARGDRRVDIRSDLYSLGVTAYHLISGRPPYEGPTAPAIMAMHVNAKLPPLREANPAVSEGMARVIERLMQKRPQDRYEDPADLLRALEGMGNGRPKADGDSRVVESGGGTKGTGAAQARAGRKTRGAEAGKPGGPESRIEAAVPPRRAVSTPTLVAASVLGLGAGAWLLYTVFTGNGGNGGVPRDQAPDPVISRPSPKGIEVPGPRKSEAALELAAIQKFASERPDDLERAALKYRALAEKFPDAPEAETARRKKEALEAQIAELAKMREAQAHRTRLQAELNPLVERSREDLGPTDAGRLLFELKKMEIGGGLPEDLARACSDAGDRVMARAREGLERDRKKAEEAARALQAAPSLEHLAPWKRAEPPPVSTEAVEAAEASAASAYLAAAREKAAGRLDPEAACRLLAGLDTFEGAGALAGALSPEAAEVREAVRARALERFAKDRNEALAFARAGDEEKAVAALSGWRDLEPAPVPAPEAAAALEEVKQILSERHVASEVEKVVRAFMQETFDLMQTRQYGAVIERADALRRKLTEAEIKAAGPDLDRRRNEAVLLFDLWTGLREKLATLVNQPLDVGGIKSPGLERRFTGLDEQDNLKFGSSSSKKPLHDLSAPDIETILGLKGHEALKHRTRYRLAVSAFFEKPPEAGLDLFQQSRDKREQVLEEEYRFYEEILAALVEKEGPETAGPDGPGKPVAPTPTQPPPPEPPRVVDSKTASKMPLDLFNGDSAKEKGEIRFDLPKDIDLKKARYAEVQIKVFDPDNKEEGDFSFNGGTVVPVSALRGWGDSGTNDDTRDFRHTVPLAELLPGENVAGFRHHKTQGYRIMDFKVSVHFGEGPPPASASTAEPAPTEGPTSAKTFGGARGMGIVNWEQYRKRTVEIAVDLKKEELATAQSAEVKLTVYDSDFDQEGRFVVNKKGTATVPSLDKGEADERDRQLEPVKIEPSWLVPGKNELVFEATKSGATYRVTKAEIIVRFAAAPDGARNEEAPVDGKGPDQGPAVGPPPGPKGNGGGGPPHKGPGGGGGGWLGGVSDSDRKTVRDAIRNGDWGTVQRIRGKYR